MASEPGPLSIGRRLRYRSAITLEVLRAPRTTLRLSSEAHARRRHAELTARHPTLRVVSSGGFGAALMPLPDTPREYLAGPSRALLRRKRRRALAAGFRFAELPAHEHVDDMLAIHRSAPVRQASPMHRQYVDETAVATYASRAGTLPAIVDSDGSMRAYAYTEVLGEVGTFQRLIGHADCLDDGLVYLLASEVVIRFISVGHETGLPRWAMCGGLWGNPQGLAYFKRRLGFEPYRARFVAEDP